MSKKITRILGIPIYSVESRSDTTTLRNPAEWLKRVFGATSSAGVDVNEDSVSNLMVAFRSIDLLASTIAGLPKGVFERLPNGDKKQLIDNDVAFSIHRPNQMMTEFVYFQTVLYQLLTRFQFQHGAIKSLFSEASKRTPS
jgi:phage portal protein BeeE